MKREMRWHDFGSGREASRRSYREYEQGERQSHGPKLVPAQRVAAKIGADIVGRLEHIRDMLCAVLRVITNFGSNAHVFHYVTGSKQYMRIAKRYSGSSVFDRRVLVLHPSGNASSTRWCGRWQEEGRATLDADRG